MGGAVLVPVAVVQYSRHHCTVRATRAGVRDATSNPTGCGYFLCLCAGRGVALPVSSVDEPAARLIRRARVGPLDGSRCGPTQVCRHVREDPARRRAAIR
jgi:hypothetical protein